VRPVGPGAGPGSGDRRATSSLRKCTCGLRRKLWSGGAFLYLVSLGLIFAMADEHQKSRKSHLAFAIARGHSAAEWARSNKIPKATAYRWAKDPKVRKAVEAYRRRIIDQAVGLLTLQTTKAASRIASISMEGDNSHSVQLRACRAIFSDMITTSKYSVLEARLMDIEERLAEQQGNVDGAVSTNYGPR
jgi:hypothetical protein